MQGYLYDIWTIKFWTVKFPGDICIVGIGALKSQVLENTSIENVSTKRTHFVMMENASTENTSTNVQGWKTQVRKRQVRIAYTIIQLASVIKLTFYSTQRHAKSVFSRPVEIWTVKTGLGLRLRLGLWLVMTVEFMTVQILTVQLRHLTREQQPPTFWPIYVVVKRLDG